MVMELIREVQDILDMFKKILICFALGLIVWYVEQNYGYTLLIPSLIGMLGMFGIYIMERFEEVLEDMDRLRVTQLAWIAETGGEDDAESSDYE
jgi:uncharacterized membrane protein